MSRAAVEASGSQPDEDSTSLLKPQINNGTDSGTGGSSGRNSAGVEADKEDSVPVEVEADTELAGASLSPDAIAAAAAVSDELQSTEGDKDFPEVLSGVQEVLFSQPSETSQEGGFDFKGSPRASSEESFDSERRPEAEEQSFEDSLSSEVGGVLDQLAPSRRGFDSAAPAVDVDPEEASEAGAGAEGTGPVLSDLLTRGFPQSPVDLNVASSPLGQEPWPAQSAENSSDAEGSVQFAPDSSDADRLPELVNNTDPPVDSIDLPVNNTDPPVDSINLNVNNTDLFVNDTDLLASNPELSVIKDSELPVSNPDLLVNNTGLLGSNPELSINSTELSASDTNIHISNPDQLVINPDQRVNNTDPLVNVGDDNPDADVIPISPAHLDVIASPPEPEITEAAAAAAAPPPPHTAPCDKDSAQAERDIEESPPSHPLDVNDSAPASPAFIHHSRLHSEADDSTPLLFASGNGNGNEPLTPTTTTTAKNTTNTTKNSKNNSNRPPPVSIPIPETDCCSGSKRMATSLEDITSLRLWKGIIAEFVGVLLLVLVGCGSCLSLEAGGSSSTVQIALCFGLSVATIVWSIGHVSGGHINPAVTLALLATRKISLAKAIFFVLFQLVGAVVGAGILMGLTPKEFQGGLGNTQVSKNLDAGKGVGVEIFITFVLVLTVFASIDSKRKDLNGSTPLTIGLSVTMCHLFAIQYTGASMNTARSFGPALVTGKWDNHWVYWVGPITGGVAAGLLYEYLFAVNASLTKVRACVLSSDYDTDKFKAKKIKVRIVEEEEEEEDGDEEGEEGRGHHHHHHHHSNTKESPTDYLPLTRSDRSSAGGDHAAALVEME
ncbi:uncharacterized protein LOC143286152 [Babylonia areolata]|uniref:uncharacterized protein LOC143286152 n=1 Tax=Babylonia areolata TaxID=304850 RepID=UPI003FD2C2C4